MLINSKKSNLAIVFALFLRTLSWWQYHRSTRPIFH